MGLIENTLSSTMMPKHKNLFTITIDGINSWQIYSAGRPSSSTNTVEIHNKNVVKKFAGKTTWNPIACEMYDFVGYSATQQLLTWATTQHNPLTGINTMPGTYKKNVTITELSNNLMPISQWVLHGAWVESWDGGDLNASSDEAQTVSFSIQYDFPELMY